MVKSVGGEKRTPETGSLKGKFAALLIRVLGYLPFFWVQNLGRFAGRLSLWINSREVRIARRNIERCFPELSRLERERFLRNSFLNSGMLAFEVAKVWRTEPDAILALVKQVRNEDVFLDAVNAGEGILLVVPHLGNWEVLNTYILKHIELWAMYSPAKLKEVDKLMCEGRSKTGLKLAEANTKGVIQLLRAISSGGSLAILPDQEPPQKGGEFAPFFGHQAFTMTLISNLLKKSNAVPIIAYARRLGAHKGFEIVFHAMPDTLRDADMQSTLSALNNAVESVIREVPEQYMWGYKRFRKRPSGEDGFYEDLR